MSSGKILTRTAGILIILGIISGILSIVPSVESENFLKEVFPNRTQVLTGSIFQFLLVPIYIGYALVLYQVLVKTSKTLSIGFVGFRMIAGAFQLLGMITLPLFILLSQKYLSAQITTELALYETIGEMLHLFRDLTNHLGVILATGLGNLLLYIIFYREKLVPVWLSVWGIAGNVLIMIGSFLLLFQLIEVVSTTYAIISLPIVIQEVVLAIWLIVKGLNLRLTEQNS